MSKITTELNIEQIIECYNSDTKKTSYKKYDDKKGWINISEEDYKEILNKN